MLSTKNFRTVEIHFTNMEILIDTLTVKVGDTVGAYGRKITISQN